MNPKEEKNNEKQVYEKPMLRIIDLSAGVQVLGVGCKLQSGGMAIGATPCVANFCVQAGS